MNDPGLPGRPGFTFRPERVALSADGFYFHHHQAHAWPPAKSHSEYWVAKFLAEPLGFWQAASHRRREGFVPDPGLSSQPYAPGSLRGGSVILVEGGRTTP